MDRKLQKPQPHNQTHPLIKLIQRSLPQAVPWLKGHQLAILFASIGLLQSGCQTQQIWNTQAPLPVPPQVLDQETLRGVRFQSPGGSGGRGGSGSSNLPDSGNFAPAPEKRHSDVVPDFEQLAEAGDGLKPDIVKEVIITGNHTLPTHHLSRNIRTRQGRYFDPDKLQQDVNMLWRMKEIKKVKGPYLDRQADGMVVRIEIEERKKLSTVAFIGNRGISDRALQKKTGLEDGSPIDVHEIRMAQKVIEEHYREKGYPRTQVEILENDGDDSRVTFLIHEDQQQKIWKVNFEGNTIATEARLRTIVKSKPGIAKVFGGLAKRSEIEQDIQRLTAYYRGLGFFNAHVGREISESNDGRWLSLRYIVNEGPRYNIRNVKFIGNQAFSEAQLASLVSMHPSKTMPDFNVAILNEDLREIRDLYGAQGFVFSDVTVENRFLEEPGQLDLVYKINEGKQYRVGQVNVHYEGGNSITKSSVIRTRIDLQPGDVIDMRKIRASEARLSRSQIFATGEGGAPPSIAIKPRELRDIETLAELDGRSSGSGSRTARAPSGGGGSGSRGSGGSGAR